MKSDLDLRKDVEAELAWDPAVRSAGIGVAVKEGVVTVTGHIDTFAEKHALEKALRRVVGVKAIALELDVRLSPEHRRSDTDIAKAAEQALRWNTSVPADRIRVIVDKGWITLEGEVEWDYQRRNAERAVRTLVGVVGISNDIVLMSQVAPDDVRRRIGEALKRHVQREVGHMEISVDGQTVTLRGTVDSWQEREAATGTAWAAPGVRTVINHLVIR